MAEHHAEITRTVMVKLDDLIFEIENMNIDADTEAWLHDLRVMQSKLRKILREAEKALLDSRSPTLRADGTTVESTSTSNEDENDRPKAPCKGKYHSLSPELQKMTFCGLCGDTGLSS